LWSASYHVGGSQPLHLISRERGQCQASHVRDESCNTSTGAITGAPQADDLTLLTATVPAVAGRERAGPT